jgi:GT2 family glycosyltransferase
MSRRAMAVCIISYNTHDLLRACLHSLAGERPDAVIVVDNGSTDGTIEMLKHDFPQVQLCQNPHNAGYGAAANQAIALSNTEDVLLLNSDTQLIPGALDQLRDVLDQQAEVAIAGPRLLNADGSLQPSCYHFPTPLEVFLDVANAVKIARRVPPLRNIYLRTWPHNAQREVDWVSGAALAIRRRAFDTVGGFDPSFTFYYEETDLCYRLRQAGWSVCFTPAASVVHMGGGSSGTGGARRPELTVQLYAGLAHFYRRHYSKAAQLVLAGLLQSVAALRYMRDRLRWARLNRPNADQRERAVVQSNMQAWQMMLRGQWMQQGNLAAPRPNAPQP